VATEEAVTASRLGLAVLTAIAVALALVVALAPAPTAMATTRPLIPGLTVDAVDRLALRRAGGAVELARHDGAWVVTAPAPGPADGAAVADLVSALAVARWDRIVRDPDSAATGLAAPRLTVEVGAAGRTTRLEVGAALAATGQVWVRVDGGPPLLTPSWLATALDRDLGALRQQRLAPVAAAAVTGVEIHGPGLDLVLAGEPLAVRGDGWTARAAPDRTRALLAAITGLVAVDYPLDAAASGPVDAAAPGPVDAAGLSVRLLGGGAPVELVERGACASGRVRVDGSAGPACVEAAAWRAVADAAAGAGTAAWIDPRPVAAPAQLTLLRTGVALRRQGGTVTVVADGREAPADPDAAARVLAALAAPGRVVASSAGAGTPVATVEEAGGATVTLSATGPATLCRDREPFALVVDAAAIAALATDARALRSRQLISDEPTALARLAISRGGRTRSVERGAVVGEWTPSGAIAAAALDAAAAALADLRALHFATAAEVGATDLRLEASFDPAPVAGAVAAHHVVELGGGRGAGCAARVDGEPVVLEPAACRALRALAP
jgi:hypothetical protein